jgi:hypothetical protein
MKDYIHVVREFDRKRKRSYVIQEIIGGVVLVMVCVFILSLPFDRLENLFLWTK